MEWCYYKIMLYKLITYDDQPKPAYNKRYKKLPSHQVIQGLQPVSMFNTNYSKTAKPPPTELNPWKGF